MENPIDNFLHRFSIACEKPMENLMTKFQKSWLVRTPLSSKKFLFASIMSLCWLLLIWYGIKNDLDKDVLISMVQFTGLAQLGYIGGQSLIDSWVKGKMASNDNNKREAEKGIIETT